MSYVPRNLSYFINRMNGYGRQTTKIMPLNMTTFNPNDIITMQLPQNQKVDLSTFTMHGTITTSDTNGATNAVVLPPKHIETIIGQLSYEANGQVVGGGCQEYGQLFKLLADWTFGQEKQNLRNVLSQGQPNNGTTYPDLSTTPTASVVCTDTPFSITNWLGLLQCEPCVVDMSAIGDLRLYFRLADKSVLVTNSSTGVAKGTYTIKNVYFTVDIIETDSLYDQMLASKLQTAPLEIYFPDYKSFTSGLTNKGQSMRFSVSSQSIDDIYGFFLPSTYNDISTTTASPYIGSSRYFIKDGSNITSSQYQLNGLFYPSFKPDSQAIIFQLTNEAFGTSTDTLGGCDPKLTSLAQFTNYFWVHHLRLNHPDPEGNRVLSGFDSRGTSANFFWNTEASSGTGYAWVYVKSSAVLKVGAYRQLQYEP